MYSFSDLACKNSSELCILFYTAIGQYDLIDG